MRAPKALAIGYYLIFQVRLWGLDHISSPRSLIQRGFEIWSSPNWRTWNDISNECVIQSKDWIYYFDQVLELDQNFDPVLWEFLWYPVLSVTKTRRLDSLIWSCIINEFQIVFSCVITAVSVCMWLPHTMGTNFEDTNTWLEFFNY